MEDFKTIEEARGKYVELVDEHTTLKGDYENLTKIQTEQDQRIKQLEEENRKLFLRVTSPSTKDDPQHNNEEMTLEDIANKIKF